MRLLEGTVEPDTEIRSELAALRREVADRTQDLRDERRHSEIIIKGVTELRHQLGPLYRALQAVFGELDILTDDVPPDTAGADPRVAAIWGSWKSKLGPQCAKVIDVLLTHGEMNTTQLAIAVGTRRQNIPNLIYKLNQAGLINKVGGRFSLKQL